MEQGLTPVAKTIIGWLETIGIWLPATGGTDWAGDFTAKVDTGACTSSLHATGILAFEREGNRFVRFQIPGGERSLEIEAPLARRGVVKTSEGRSEWRYFIEARIQAATVIHPLLFSLNDRSGMTYPVLLGRNFLRDRYMVDVSRRFLLERARALPSALP